MKIGFIGFGEASSKICYGLSKEKTDSIFYAYDVATLHNDNVSVCNSIGDVIKNSESIFVAVPGTSDKNVFSEILKSNIEDKLIIDICTTKPIIKESIEKEVINRKGKYVDVAVLGPVSKLLHKTPMLVSGSGSKDMKSKFSKYNMNISIKEGSAGMASTIKLCRSIFMKGLSALAIETIEACEKYGVKDDVFNSIYENVEEHSFEVLLDTVVKGAYVHTKRQFDEICYCIELENEISVIPNMSFSTKNIFESLLKNKK